MSCKTEQWIHLYKVDETSCGKFSFFYDICQADYLPSKNIPKNSDDMHVIKRILMIGEIKKERSKIYQILNIDRRRTQKNHQVNIFYCGNFNVNLD